MLFLIEPLTFIVNLASSSGCGGSYGSFVRSLSLHCVLRRYYWSVLLDDTLTKFSSLLDLAEVTLLIACVLAPSLKIAANFSFSPQALMGWLGWTDLGRHLFLLFLQEFLTRQAGKACMSVITLLPIINVKIRGSSEATRRRKNNQSTATNSSLCLSVRRFFHTFWGIFPCHGSCRGFILSLF